jgi:hypothetical protein
MFLTAVNVSVSALVRLVYKFDLKFLVVAKTAFVPAPELNVSNVVLPLNVALVPFNTPFTVCDPLTNTLPVN